MNKPLLCPKCKTNRSRFNFLEQTPEPVRCDPFTGEVVSNSIEEFQNNPLHIQYNGPEYLIQCGVCGNLESGYRFKKMAESYPPERRN